MAGSDVLDREWESQAAVDAVLSETGVTKDQVNRWRREGLLPRDVDQDQQAYRGSVVRYPMGTCAQIKAAAALFKEKNRVDYVGLRLWRLGFPVDEKYWRPRLRWMGRLLDRVLPLVAWLVERFDRNLEGETFQERAARELEGASNIILSRIKKRINSERLPAFISVISDLGTGDFIGFEQEVAGEEHNGNKAIVVQALDLENAKHHSILGAKLNLVELLPSGFDNVSAAMSMGNFEQVADAPTEEIAKARDDARNAVLIGLYLYDAMRWVYGDGAFGLRFLAWIARKAPDDMIDGMMLGMFRLRQVPGAIMTSEQIADLAKQAHEAWKSFKHYEWLWRNDPRYTEVLNPSRIKKAFADKIALKRWHEQVKAVSLQPSDETSIGQQ